MSACCHACSRAGTDICTAEFVCTTCYRGREVCSHLPGGLQAYTREVRLNGAECVMCQEKRIMDEAWVNEWHRKKET